MTAIKPHTVHTICHGSNNGSIAATTAGPPITNETVKTGSFSRYVMVRWEAGTCVAAVSNGDRIIRPTSRKRRVRDLLHGVVVGFDSSAEGAEDAEGANYLVIEYWSIYNPATHYQVRVPRATACQSNGTQWGSIDSDENRCIFHRMLW